MTRITHRAPRIVTGRHGNGACSSCSGLPGPAERQRDGVVEAQRQAVGVGLMKLRVAEMTSHRGDAVLPVPALGILPRPAQLIEECLSRPVKPGGLMPVAQVAGDAGQAELARSAASGCPAWPVGRWESVDARAPEACKTSESSTVPAGQPQAR